MSAPVDRTVVWPFDDAGEPGAYFYARYAHPTGVAAEAALGALEGGDAVLFASGMAAETAVLLAFTETGTTVAVAEGCYYGTSTLLRALSKFGVNLIEFDQTGPPPAEATIVWVESPANPTLSMPNWEAVTSTDALLVCDATLSTPVYLQALDEGADIVVHSATKYLTGHHDALLGVTVTRDPEKTAALQQARTLYGGAASADTAYSLLRGLDTLETRMLRQTTTATELAARLEAHPAVAKVRYPGFAGVIAFDVDDPRRVETSLATIRNSTSLGGVTSSIESRHRWEGDRIPTGLLRLSVGLEDVELLWGDLKAALAN
ncbi:MAG: PLP-dependent transferase [Actinobacteria bacterium]|uniref:Unannotated protein n=1 Tax=freshwater metagenome TaxID=449393 RepID=A0A6J6NVF1_9ZZZZ|nr:PLP-dependent transferase [Actinomycetota bacterium]